MVPLPATEELGGAEVAQGLVGTQGLADCLHRGLGTQAAVELAGDAGSAAQTGTTAAQVPNGPRLPHQAESQ